VATASSLAGADGRASGCRLVALGVETEGEAKTLAGLGVDFAQGNFFGRPELATKLSGRRT
jgi:EAL domain-containing protein (putative c-di-GMP-specific phosphodiesterase class I)